MKFSHFTLIFFLNIFPLIFSQDADPYFFVSKRERFELSKALNEHHFFSYFWSQKLASQIVPELIVQNGLANIRATWAKMMIEGRARNRADQNSTKVQRFRRSWMGDALCGRNPISGPKLFE